MSAKSFEEWYAKERGNLALYTMDDDLRAAWTASRAALLADRPDVAGIVKDMRGLVNGEGGRAKFTDIADALESLAAQLAEHKAAEVAFAKRFNDVVAERDAAQAELAKVKALAEKMHAELKEYENSPFRHTSNSAWEYRAAYPKDAP